MQITLSYNSIEEMREGVKALISIMEERQESLPEAKFDIPPVAKPVEDKPKEIKAVEVKKPDVSAIKAELKKLLASKLAEGKKVQVQGLLTAHGAKSLTELCDKHFDELDDFKLEAEAL